VVPNPLALNLADQPFIGMNDKVVVISAKPVPLSSPRRERVLGLLLGPGQARARADRLHQSRGLLCSVSFQTFGPYRNLATIHPAHCTVRRDGVQASVYPLSHVNGRLTLTSSRGWGAPTASVTRTDSRSGR